MTINKTNDVMGLDRLFDKTSIKEKTLKPYKAEVTRIEDIIKITKNKTLALYEMQKKVSAIQLSATKLGPLAGPEDDAFGQKTCEITTTDNGNGDDYLEVTTKPNAPLGDINIKVLHVAKAASVVLGCGVGNQGFAIDEAITNTFDRITIDGQDIAVGLNDNIFDLVKNINEVVSPHTNASVIKNNNQYFLTVRSTNTGARSINITAGNLGVGVDMAPLTLRNTDGENARIMVNGVIDIVSQSNIIRDIMPGVTVNLKQVNTDGNEQTIQIKPDVEVAKQMIMGLLSTCNDYLDFSSKQQERTLKDYKDTAFLHGSYELRMTDDTIMGITNPLPLGAGVLNSLTIMGIGFEKVPADKESPSRWQIMIKNGHLFNDAVENKFEEVRNLFKGTTVLGVHIDGLAANLANKMASIEANSIQPAIARIEEEQVASDEKMKKAQKLLDERQAKLEADFNKIELISIEANLFMELLEGMNQ